ncbi:hypothetical protein B9Z65_3799 [Elsinoe australis]|uniref:Uncharacterized protein n=1 Tax=Elsinoe australis TaxID=40998 RepID=A0A2P8AG86_9PEZI|nr:hypothetical protein B9Z65_3799 [Elsinoe australis]
MTSSGPDKVDFPLPAIHTIQSHSQPFKSQSALAPDPSPAIHNNALPQAQQESGKRPTTAKSIPRNSYTANKSHTLCYTSAEVMWLAGPAAGKLANNATDDAITVQSEEQGQTKCGSPMFERAPVIRAKYLKSEDGKD